MKPSQWRQFAVCLLVVSVLGYPNCHSSNPPHHCKLLEQVFPILSSSFYSGRALLPACWLAAGCLSTSFLCKDNFIDYHQSSELISKICLYSDSRYLLYPYLFRELQIRFRSHKDESHFLHFVYSSQGMVNNSMFAYFTQKQETCLPCKQISKSWIFSCHVFVYSNQRNKISSSNTVWQHQYMLKLSWNPFWRCIDMTKNLLW